MLERCIISDRQQDTDQNLQISPTFKDGSQLYFTKVFGCRKLVKFLFHHVELIAWQLIQSFYAIPAISMRRTDRWTEEHISYSNIVKVV